MFCIVGLTGSGMAKLDQLWLMREATHSHSVTCDSGAAHITATWAVIIKV